MWARACATPDAVAVVDPTANTTLTYVALFEAAAALAVHFKPGVRVGLVLRKGWRQAVGVLAAALADATYVPINPSWPRKRVEATLAGARVACVVVDEGRFDGVECLTIAADARAPVSVPAVQRSSAYIIFTSGSTGVPKGVVLEWPAVANTVHAINAHFGVGPTDRTYAHASLSFDLSVYDLWGPWSVGGGVVFCGPDTTNNPVVGRRRHAWCNRLEHRARRLRFVVDERTASDGETAARCAGERRLVPRWLGARDAVCVASVSDGCNGRRH